MQRFLDGGYLEWRALASSGCERRKSGEVQEQCGSFEVVQGYIMLLRWGVESSKISQDDRSSLFVRRSSFLRAEQEDRWSLLVARCSFSEEAGCWEWST